MGSGLDGPFESLITEPCAFPFGGFIGFSPVESNRGADPCYGHDGTGIPKPGVDQAEMLLRSRAIALTLLTVAAR
jgi:hypothetical protein